ncbi:MAG: histidine--tRNA ligase [Candidatus Niyogibacteria bacterium]|nr:histidine--tRNA ligase [Candidatus Niyogibacteria bacterium]
MKIKNKKELLQTPKGMRDILPHDLLYWKAVETKAEDIARSYGFKPIRTPHVEKAELFGLTLGETSDIVEKQMYAFKTRGGDALVLRPEGTVPMMRAYFEHGMHTWPQPVMLYYSGSFFRHENPQRGRWREFGQFGVEIMGEESGLSDAYIIHVFALILQELGFKKFTVHVNTLGDKECRGEFRKELVAYYRRKVNSICRDCKRRLKENPLRLLDCKNPMCVEVRADAPQMMSYACLSCRAHFKLVLEFLDDFEIPYKIAPHLVRGLDYYSRTVFEIFADADADTKKEKADDASTETGGEKTEPQKEKEKEKENAAPIALAAGGRYDYLAEVMGDRKVPGVGGALGLDRIVDELKERKIVPFKEKAPAVFLVQIGAQAKRKSLVLFEQLRKSRFGVAQSFSRDNLRTQLDLANKLGAAYALIIGQKEALDGTVIVRDMGSGTQESVYQKKVLDHLKKKMKNS